jgi:hypothetical protein
MRKQVYVTLTILLVALAVMSLHAQYGPDTCRQGHVWRDAFPGDHVCVIPETRTQSAYDNSQANARRQPGGGPYGPDTCRQGYVWREARPDDHVCVTPDVRSLAASDNSQAAARRANGSTTPAICRRYADRAVQQHQIMLNHPKCRVSTDGRWHSLNQNHYNWCLTAQRAWTQSEEKIRDDHLYKCGGQIRFDNSQ